MGPCDLQSRLMVLIVRDLNAPLSSQFRFLPIILVVDATATHPRPLTLTPSEGWPHFYHPGFLLAARGYFAHPCDRPECSGFVTTLEVALDVWQELAYSIPQFPLPKWDTVSFVLHWLPEVSCGCSILSLSGSSLNNSPWLAAFPLPSQVFTCHPSSNWCFLPY